MSEQLFILQGTQVVPENNLIKWARWFEKADRCVSRTIVDELRISTVFLGLNHNFSGRGTPLLFETMVFPQESMSDLYCERYSTYEEAQNGHDRTVKKCISGEIC